MTKFWKQMFILLNVNKTGLLNAAEHPPCEAVTEKSPAEEEFNKFHLTEMGNSKHKQLSFLFVILGEAGPRIKDVTERRGKKQTKT